jgi:hypothetical protein
LRELTDTEQRAIDQLANAFRGVKLGLWTGGRINAAPSRHEKIGELQKKSEGAWSAADIDWLYFKAATTAGDDETVKYVFVRLVELLLRDAVFGSVSAGILANKLDYAHFETWPEPQRKAVLAALEALAAYWTSLGYWDDLGLTEVNDFIARHSDA